MIAFEEYLKENLVLLDGAMGSLIYEKGVFCLLYTSDAADEKG